MKKAFALIMAIAMVASMAAVSFAVTFVNDEKEEVVAGALTAFNEETYNIANNGFTPKDKFAFGKTVYLLPYASDGETEGYVTEEKTFSNLSLKAVWDEGAEYVESVEVVKKKVNVSADESDRIYFVAINTAGSNTKDVEVAGTIYLKGRSGDKIDGKQTKIDGYVDVEFTLGYDGGDVTKTIGDLKVYDLEAEDEYELDFGGKFTVTVNAKSEKKVLLECDEEVIDEIDEAYPDANIDYYALTGAFKKTAEVVVELEDGEEFLYEVVDGTVVEVDGEYDDWSEEFTFKTRKLGTYIISDVELDVAADVVVTNPSTGAAA